MKPILPTCCLKCIQLGINQTSKNSRHHIYPKVHFGDGPRVTLCRDHHDELEDFLQREENCGKRNPHKAGRKKRSRQFYQDCLLYYLLIL